jgi:cytochrome P450
MELSAMSRPPPHRTTAPGPPGHFLLGNLREFRRDVLGLVVGAAAEYGDIVRCRLGPQVVHLVNHPEPIGEILQKRAANYDKHTRSSAAIHAISGDSLLTCNGEFWKRQRRMDAPAFHHRQIAGFADKMTAAAAAMLDKWRAGPQTLDIASEMARLTYSIVGQTLFSFNTGEDAETVERAMRVMLPHVFKRLGNLISPPGWLPTPANRRFSRSLADVDRVVYRIIEQHRRAEESDRPDNDLLAMLMSVRDVDGAGLDDRQLRNETITFLLAGHETTANALTWIFHLISRHAEVERRLLEEISSVLGGRTPGLQDLPQLTYTKAVIQESMRLYPPIWIIERRVIQEDNVGGYTLPAGSSVVISPYALHRHPGFWEEPERFDPERFLAGVPEAYIPFGAGPRFCIGNEFAMMEAQLITAMVVRAFHLAEVPGQTVEPQPDITLRPKGGMRMTLHPR